MARSTDLVLATRISLPQVFVKKCLLFIVQFVDYWLRPISVESYAQRCIFVLRLDKVYNT